MKFYDQKSFCNFKSVLLLLIFFCTACVSGESSDSLKLYKILEGLDSLSARFKHRIAYDQINQSVESVQGIFRFMKPHQMRWTIDPPAAQDITTDGKTIWIYDIELEQVIIDNFNSDLMVTPGMLLSSSLEEINSVYRISQHRTDNRKAHFVLEKKSATSLFSKMEIIFVDDLLYRLIISSEDQVNDFSFTDVQCEYGNGSRYIRS